MITLNELHIKTRFKNIEDLHIDFTKNDAVTVFIGNNGSGKSNIIEALSSIFAGLYNNEMNPEFSYELKYKKDNNDILITYNHTSTRNKYTFNNIPEGNYLPNQIIGLYSGEELRLWERYYFKFYDSYNKNVLSSKAPVSEYMKMLFINKYHWDIALLTMLQSDLEIDDILGDKEVSTITFYFDKNAIENVKNYNEKNPNEVTRFSLKILDTVIGHIESNNGITSIEFPIELFKKEFVQTHTEFFKLLSVALLPRESSWKLITSIELWFRNGFSSKELSEGEKKLLLIKFITRILSDDNSLFLLDEPDSHIHINNKEQIKKQLYDFDHKAYVQSIITTHSPTLTTCFKAENLFMLDKGKLVEKQKHEIIQSLTGEFWNSQQQNIFLSSEKPIILLVEGKHDKEHISNAFNALKDEYIDLDFEIFKLNTETNIQPFLRGLYESEFDNSKLYIGLFDRENKILNDFKNPKNYTPIDSKNFFKILESDKPNTNYYVTTLPEIETKKCDCSIEMMYEYSKWEDAYQQAVLNTIGKTTNKSIKTYSEDVLNDAKNILSDNSKLFSKSDFKYFRKLFDLIKEIVKYKTDNKIVAPVAKITSSKPTPTTPDISAIKLTAKDNHLAYWTAFKEFVEQQKISFKVQKPQAQHWSNISIGKSDFRIALIANTQKKWICVQLNCLGKNALADFRKLKAKYEQDASINLSAELEWKENEGKQEHHINLVFADKNPFDKADWNNQHKLLTDWTEKFYNYFKDKLKNLDN